MLAMLLVRQSAASIPIPTAAQLAYQEQEIVALTHFNMATFYRNGDPACDASNWATSQLPSSFAPSNLNISNWLESYHAAGAQSAILTAKHGCGFLLWPTNITLPNGKNYGYHVGGSGGIGVDVVGEFAKTMTAAAMPHSFYYSLKDSYYLNAINDNVKDPTTLLPGMINATQDQFEDVSVAAITELWTQYGALNEIWFDGGISERIKGRVVPLLQKLQPNAVTYGAGIENDANEVDWIGTETGEPTYPVWSTGCNAPGAGGKGTIPDSSASLKFCPKGADVTLQSPDVWFWVPKTPIKSLATLIEIYHDTVGANAVMEMDFAIDRTGNVDPTHALRYNEFGSWVASCYGAGTQLDRAVATAPWTLGSSLTLTVPGGGTSVVDRIAIMEDLSRGQRVTKYAVEASMDGTKWSAFASGTSIGHKRINVAKNGAAWEHFRLTIKGGVELPANVSLAVFAPCPKK